MIRHVLGVQQALENIEGKGMKWEKSYPVIEKREQTSKKSARNDAEIEDWHVHLTGPTTSMELLISVNPLMKNEVQGTTHSMTAVPRQSQIRKFFMGTL